MRFTAHAGEALWYSDATFIITYILLHRRKRFFFISAYRQTNDIYNRMRKNTHCFYALLS